MKNKEKKIPKQNPNDYILSSDAEAVLYGLILVLLSLIGFLNYGVVGEALTYIFSYVFGIFYIFVYLLLIFFGLYLMIKKEMFKVHIDLKVLGSILLVLGFCIAASMKSGIYIDTFFSSYQNQINETQRYVFSMISTDKIFANLGGGFIGYLLVGAFNSAITEVGTSIVVFVFIILGLILLFKDLFVRFIKFIVRFYKKRKEIRKIAKEEREEKENKEPEEDKKDEETSQISTVNSLPLFDEIEVNNESHRVQASDIINQLEIDEVEDYQQETDSEINNEEIIQKPVEIISNDNLYADEINENVVTEEIIESRDVLDSLFDNPIEKIVNEPEEEIFEDSSFGDMDTNSQIEENQYVLPPLSLLKDHRNQEEVSNKIELAEKRLRIINECFNDFNIGATAISYTIGPSVTRFDIKMNPGVKTNILCSIENDLAVKLGGIKTVRLETIVEGKDTSGIEIGNEVSEIVSFKECLSKLESNKKDKLLFPLGKNISGDIITCKLDDMPHLLVCGTTGSGKSVFVHNIIMSLIMRNRPDELKLMLIDKKILEFAKYQDIPHLLCPIINSADEGKVGLTKLVEEMERRYNLFAKQGHGATNYKEYMEVCEEFGYEKIPYIVLFAEEFADFIGEENKENGKLIQRLAQMARACGIHMVIATQRPSAKIVTGEIKANIPSRIALKVASNLESRIIIDEPGAENLMGRGDLLANLTTRNATLRVQSAYLDKREIYDVCEFIKQQAPVSYDPRFENLKPQVITPYEMAQSGLGDPNAPYRDLRTDPRYEKVKEFVISTGQCSSSKLMNQFGIGFTKADGFLDALEKDGIIRKEGNRRILCDEYRHND